MVKNKQTHQSYASVPHWNTFCSTCCCLNRTKKKVKVYKVGVRFQPAVRTLTCQVRGRGLALLTYFSITLRALLECASTSAATEGRPLPGAPRRGVFLAHPLQTYWQFIAVDYSPTAALASASSRGTDSSCSKSIVCLSVCVCV